MKTVSILLLIASFAIQVSIQDKCHWKEMDLCTATGLLSMQTTAIPKTEDDISSHCLYFTEAINCFGNYSKDCMTGLHRELFSFITDGMVNKIDDFCTPGNEMRTNLLKHAECIANSWEEDSSALTDALVAIESMTDNDDHHKIIIACCAYQRFRKHAYKNLRDKCGEETEKYVDNLIAMFLSDIPNVVCSNFDPAESKCLEALPPVGSKLKGNSKSRIAMLIQSYIGQ